MALRFLLDENQRGMLWRYIRRHNAGTSFPLDIVRVGDSPDLPLGTDDPAVLVWAERAGRILVSADRATLAKNLEAHIGAGRRSPGIFMLRVVPLSDVLEFLVLAAHASDAGEWENRIAYIP